MKLFREKMEQNILKHLNVLIMIMTMMTKKLMKKPQTDIIKLEQIAMVMIFFFKSYIHDSMKICHLVKIIIPFASKLFKDNTNIYLLVTLKLKVKNHLLTLQTKNQDITIFQKLFYIKS